MAQPLWKLVWWFHTKLNILSPYNPANALFGIYPNELKTHVHIKTCTWIFISSLFGNLNSFVSMAHSFIELPKPLCHDRAGNKVVLQ